MNWESFLTILEKNMDIINVSGVESRLGMGTGTLRRIILEKRESKQYGTEIRALFGAFAIEINNSLHET